MVDIPGQRGFGGLKASHFRFRNESRAGTVRGKYCSVFAYIQAALVGQISALFQFLRAEGIHTTIVPGDCYRLLSSIFGELVANNRGERVSGAINGRAGGLYGGGGV